MKTVGLIITGLIAFHLSSHSQDLNDYLKIAEENNPRLKSAYHEYEASLQKINQSGTLADPSISGSYAVPFKKMDMPFVRSNIAVMQMLPWFGTLKVERNTAALGAISSYQSYRNERNELFLNVKLAYYTLVETTSQLKLMHENINILRTYKTLATTAISNGKSSLVEALRVEMMITETETEINIANLKLKALRSVFVKLLNVDNKEIQIPDSISVENLPVRNTDSLFANPKIKTLEMNYKKAEAEEQLMIKNSKPQFTVGLSYQRMVNLEQTETMSMVMPMAGMTLPIYRKKYNSAIKESKSIQKAYQQMKIDMSNSIFVEYENASFEINKANEMIKLYNQQCQKTETIIRLMLTAYSNSGGSLEDILKMQQEILRYKIALITAKKEYAKAYSAIAYAFGESEG